WWYEGKRKSMPTKPSKIFGKIFKISNKFYTRKLKQTEELLKFLLPGIKEKQLLSVSWPQPTRMKI
ncbi:unnamed protein product, partial [Sphenostylis stenocarpa]